MEMIKKLRRKLIGVSMLSLLAVLMLIVSAANLLNYRQTVQEADQILDVLAENGGSFPEMGPSFPDESIAAPDESRGFPDESMIPSNESMAPPDGGITPPESKDSHDFEGRPDSRRMNFSVETPFETRYFSVIYHDSGDPDIELGRIAAVNEEEALSLAEQAVAGGKSRGFSGDYRYSVTEDGSDTLVLFLDRGRNLSTFYRFLLTSYGTSLLGLLGVFALISFFSGRITQPFVENYEKQRRFITDAGHELKTPLAIIEADTDVLEMDLGEENEWVQDIQKQTRRLADLTKNLISLARMEEGGTHFTMIDFPVSEVITEEAESYRGPAISQGKTFTLSVEPLLTLHGDEAALRQLTGILLDNALKYSEEHGTIALELSRQGKNLLLKVSNTAEHISRENTSHMFERFYRGDASRNSGTGGYGIGLSIAQAITAAHKGKISASTRDERSLDITAVFPGCTVAEPEEA